MDIMTAYRKFVRRGDVVLDVGAFQGDVSLALSEQVGETGRVLSIEPHPVNFFILAAKAAYAPLPNIYPFQRALSDQAGHAILHFNSRDQSSQASTIVPELASAGRLGAEIRRCKIETETLDHFCQTQNAAPDFIKIDTEGAERAVFRGAALTVATLHPTILFESAFGQGLSPPYEVVPAHAVRLEQQGYRLFIVDVYYHRRRHLTAADQMALPQSLIALDTRELHHYSDDFCGVNVLAVHRSKMDLLPVAENTATQSARAVLGF